MLYQCSKHRYKAPGDVTNERIGFIRMDTIPQNTPQKQCSKCSRWYPATKEHFHVQKQLPDKLHVYCKICRNTPAAVPDGYRQCTRCKETKPSEDYPFDEHLNIWHMGWCSFCRKVKETEKELKRIESQIEKENKLEELKKTKEGKKYGLQGIKPCKCGENDPLQFYYTTVRGERKRRKVCKKCEPKVKAVFINPDIRSVSPKQKEWRRNHPDYYLRWTYNMSGKEYQAMLDGQSGVCKICGNPPKEGKSLAVDHCHKTGKIRGLLCTSCNKGLGLFCDNPTFLRSAAEYLEEE